MVVISLMICLDKVVVSLEGTRWRDTVWMEREDRRWWRLEKVVSRQKVEILKVKSSYNICIFQYLVHWKSPTEKKKLHWITGTLSRPKKGVILQKLYVDVTVYIPTKHEKIMTTHRVPYLHGIKIQLIVNTVSNRNGRRVKIRLS